MTSASVASWNMTTNSCLFQFTKYNGFGFPGHFDATPLTPVSSFQECQSFVANQTIAMNGFVFDSTITPPTCKGKAFQVVEGNLMYLQAERGMVLLGAFGGDAFTKPGLAIKTVNNVKSGQQCSDLCPDASGCVLAVYNSRALECNLATLGATKDGMAIHIITEKRCSSTIGSVKPFGIPLNNTVNEAANTTRKETGLLATSTTSIVEATASLITFTPSPVANQESSSAVNLTIGGKMIELPKTALIAGGASVGVVVFLGVALAIVRWRRSRKQEVVNPVLGKPNVNKSSKTASNSELTYEQRMMQWLFKRSASLPTNNKDAEDSEGNVFKEASSKTRT
ncbi:hypothetical protein BDR26DRAFT_1013293 [Obelidium mucronatum]|nr:hypothetical protein BDR26DRAFT_1013293 [Obelidium mucronatum]